MKAIDIRSGELSECECKNCVALTELFLKVEQDSFALEKDLRKVRRERDAARSELSNQRASAIKHKGAEAIFRYWVQRCGKNPKTTLFGEARQKAVLKALDGHTHAYIARAIDGAAHESWRWSTELEYICRNEVNLERLHIFAENHNADSLVGPAWTQEFGDD